MQKCSVNIEKIPWNLEKIEKSIHLESFNSINNLNYKSSLETIDQNNTELPNEELENNEQIDIKHEFNSENEINELINKNVEEVDYDQIFDGEEIYFEGLNDESQSYNEDLQSDNEEMLDEKINDEESFTFANNIQGNNIVFKYL